MSGLKIQDLTRMEGTGMSDMLSNLKIYDPSQI